MIVSGQPAPPRWRGKACRKDFSLTSGTLFAFHKLPLVLHLTAIVLFVNEVKGKNALALSRDLSVQYKTAFVLAHKIREAMAAEIKGGLIGGADRAVEVDGCCVGGHIRPENEKKDRKDRRLSENQSGKRRVVVALHERWGRTLTSVFKSEAAAVAFINAPPRSTPTKPPTGTPFTPPSTPSASTTRTLIPWTAPAPTGRKASSPVCAVARASANKVCAIGHHHHIAGVYLARYARDAAFREDHHRHRQRRTVRPGGAAGHQERPLGRFLRLLAARAPRRVISAAPATSPSGLRRSSRPDRGLAG
jgi:hypothetical protein